MASFGRLRGSVDPAAARGYPLQPVPAGHLNAVLRDRAGPAGGAPRLALTEAVAGLRRSRSGLLVC